MDEHRNLRTRIIEGMRKEQFFGAQEQLENCLGALYTDGHVLLEGDPGVGKTTLVTTLNKVLGMDPVDDWKRIQFTPDLLPSDVTGTEVPVKDGAGVTLVFRPGPIFATLVLADEINRATPKSQSALLEAMAERQVSVLGKTYSVPSQAEKTGREKGGNQEPFMVLATQNPIDHEGTYDLPKALLDRFMFKLEMPKLTRSGLVDVLRKNCDPPALRESHARPWLLEQGFFKETFHEIREGIKMEALAPEIHTQIVEMAMASNQEFGEMQEASAVLKNEVPAKLAYGLGPRAWSSLVLALKAEKYFTGRNPGILEEDQKALRRLMHGTLAHRLALNEDFEAEARSSGDKDPRRPFLETLYRETLRDASGRRKQ